MGKPKQLVLTPYLGDIAMDKKKELVIEFQEMQHESIDLDSDLRLRMNENLSVM
jgi:hypothetical protein